jgi:hypothetical protein
MNIHDWITRNIKKPLQPAEVDAHLEEMDQRQLPGIKAWLLGVQEAHDNKVGGGTFPWAAVLSIVSTLLTALAGNPAVWAMIQSIISQFFPNIPLPPIPVPPAPNKTENVALQETPEPAPKKK